VLNVKPLEIESLFIMGAKTLAAFGRVRLNLVNLTSTILINPRRITT
jgi:hypothetical protein